MKKITIITIVTVFLIGCDKLDEKLRLVNISAKELFYVVSYKDDLIYNDNLDINSFPNFDTVKVGIIGGTGAWEYHINKRGSDSTLFIYIFSEKNITEQIIESNLYQKKGFKVKDLDSLNWIVTYPDDFE